MEEKIKPNHPKQSEVQQNFTIFRQVLKEALFEFRINKDSFEAILQVIAVGTDKKKSLMCGSLEIQYQDDKVITISQTDLVGAEVIASKNILRIYEYPYKKQGLFGGFVRTLNYYDLYDSNVKNLTDWHHIILHFSHNNYEFLYELSNNKQLEITPFIKKLLVFINPEAGNGSAPQNWQLAKKLLSKAGYIFQEVYTSYYRCCYEYIASISFTELLKYDGILTCGGDGMPHEIVNALLHRPEDPNLLQIPIGMLHGGSGNAIITSLCADSREKNNLESAIYIIAKGQTKKMDVIEIQRINQQSLYSLMTISWAFIADIDSGSEKLRFLGTKRFDVYALYQLIDLQQYYAKLYIVNDASISLPPLGQSLDNLQSSEQIQVVKDNFHHILINNLPYIAEKLIPSPLSQKDDGFCEIQYMMAHSGKWQMLKYAYGMDKGQHIDRNKGTVAKGYAIKYQKMTSFRFVPDCQSLQQPSHNPSGGASKQLALNMNGMINPSSSNLEESLGSGKLTQAEEAQSSLCSQKQKPPNGVETGYCSGKEGSKQHQKASQCISSNSNNNYGSGSAEQNIKINECWISAKPKNPLKKKKINKYLLIDGEQYPIEPIQGKLIKQLVNVYCL